MSKLGGAAILDTYSARYGKDRAGLDHTDHFALKRRHSLQKKRTVTVGQTGSASKHPDQCLARYENVTVITYVLPLA